MILAQDDFNRANNASLGADWVEASGQWEIDTNRLQCAVGQSSPDSARMSSAGNILDVKVSVDIVNSSGDGGVVCRWNAAGAITAGSSNCYLLNVWGNEWAIYKYINGNQSAIAQGTGVTMVANGIARLEVEGSGGTVTLRAYYNGTLRGTGSDTSGTRIVSAGAVGVVAWAVSGTAGGVGDYDNFLVEDYGPAFLLEQEGFRWRNDDADEDSATWKANQDTNVTLVGGDKARVRFAIDGTADNAPKQPQLEFRKVGDTDWRKVNP
jgi:hypothetical protein